jgi:hypothetical protein
MAKKTTLAEVPAENAVVLSDVHFSFHFADAATPASSGGPGSIHCTVNGADLHHYRARLSPAQEAALGAILRELALDCLDAQDALEAERVARENARRAAEED